MYDRFFNFAIERHNIYLRRQRGMPRPWTHDQILNTYRFTNVFRELDATTVWFRENVRDKQKTPEDIVLATVVFRLFNRITTGEAIFLNQDLAGMTAWEHYRKSGNAESMRPAILTYCGDGPYCTGAYIINSPNYMDKLTGVLTMIQWVTDDIDSVVEDIQSDGTLEGACKRFQRFNHIAAFTSYEFVSDLRHTPVLNNAPDIMTWANPGPGAMRGLNRIHGRDLRYRYKKHPWVEEMRDILEKSPQYWPEEFPTLEMRDIEHTLCEFDKYERVRNGEGRPRGRYP